MLINMDAHLPPLDSTWVLYSNPNQSTCNLKVMSQPSWRVGVASCAWDGWVPCLHHSLYAWPMCCWMGFFVWGGASIKQHLLTYQYYMHFWEGCIPWMGPQDASFSYIATNDVFPNASLHRQHHTSATLVLNSLYLTQSWYCTCLAPNNYWIHDVPPITPPHHHTPSSHWHNNAQPQSHTTSLHPFASVPIYIHIYIYIYACAL